MKKSIVVSILLIVPGMLWCSVTHEVLEHVGVLNDHYVEPVREETPPVGVESVLTDHKDLFADADVSELLDQPDVLNHPVDDKPIESVQQPQIQSGSIATVTTSLDPLVNDFGTQQSVDGAADKDRFLSEVSFALSQGEFFISRSQKTLTDLDNNPNAMYADYAQVLQGVEQHVKDIVDLQDRVINFDYLSEDEQVRVGRYQDGLDAQIQAGRDLLAQLQKPLERKALTDLPMINKKLQGLQTAFTKINKSTWWGGKSLADVASQLNELHLILDNALKITPDFSYQETIQNMKDIVQILDQKLVKMQLDALRSQNLISKSANAIEILKSQPAVGYTASTRGKAEMKDARQVLKELDAILLDDPLYHERYLKVHDKLAFERFNQALDAAGIERGDDEAEEGFLNRPEVQELQKELFPQIPDAGAWKDSLDFNVALINAKYLRETYEAKKGMQEALKKDYGLDKLVQEANKRFTSKKRSSKTEFFPIEDSQSQSRGSIASQ